MRERPIPAQLPAHITTPPSIVAMLSTSQLIAKLILLCARTRAHEFPREIQSQRAHGHTAQVAVGRKLCQAPLHRPQLPPAAHGLVVTSYLHCLRDFVPAVAEHVDHVALLFGEKHARNPPECGEKPRLAHENDAHYVLVEVIQQPEAPGSCNLPHTGAGRRREREGPLARQAFRARGCLHYKALSWAPLSSI